MPAAVWDTRDPQVVRDYLAAPPTTATDVGALDWVTGHPADQAWVAARFAQRHRVAADQHRAAGDTVGWRYREFVDPFQGTPGFSPAEGDSGSGGARRPDRGAHPRPVARLRARQRGEADAALAALARAAAPPAPRRSGTGRALCPRP